VRTCVGLRNDDAECRVVWVQEHRRDIFLFGNHSSRWNCIDEYDFYLTTRSILSAGRRRTGVAITRVAALLRSWCSCVRACVCVYVYIIRAINIKSREGFVSGRCTILENRLRQWSNGSHQFLGDDFFTSPFIILHQWSRKIVKYGGISFFFRNYLVNNRPHRVDARIACDEYRLPY